jgi:predicted  nucleic acid-binding Zn-ribbon protein
MEELKELMRAIQSYLPMEVCESSDIKFLNRRLREVEEKIVSLESSNEQRKKDLKHAWNLYEEIVRRTEKTTAGLVEENKKLNAHLIEHYGGK